MLIIPLVAEFRSSTGIVNLYENDYSTEAAAPKLVKSFDNITTSISSMCFNPDGQILAAASKEKKDTLKLVRPLRLHVSVFQFPLMVSLLSSW